MNNQNLAGLHPNIASNPNNKPSAIDKTPVVPSNPVEDNSTTYMALCGEERCRFHKLDAVTGCALGAITIGAGGVCKNRITLS